MNKNIVIAILVVISVCSLTFGIYQRSLTKQALVLAAENEKMARDMTMEATMHMKVAEEQRLIVRANLEAAILQQAELEAELKKCKRK